MVDDPTSASKTVARRFGRTPHYCSFSFESELIEAGTRCATTRRPQREHVYHEHRVHGAGGHVWQHGRSMRPIPYEQVAGRANFRRHSEGSRRTDSSAVSQRHRHWMISPSLISWRCGQYSRGRGARVPGPCGVTPVGRREREAEIRHHPRARLHAHHRHEEHLLKF